MNQPEKQPLIGLAALATLAFKGNDLTAIGDHLIERINARPDDAEALMDLSIIHFLSHQPESAMELQQQACDLQVRYALSMAPTNPTMRMLAIMGPGGLMDNLPLEFLLEGSAIRMDLHYMELGSTIPQDMNDYDLIWIAVGESDLNMPLLHQLEVQFHGCSVPILNRPEYIMQTTREDAASALQDATGVVMPASVRIPREKLALLALNKEGGEANRVSLYLPEQDFPLIVRPVESHAGHGLMRLDKPADIASYLTTQPEDLFYISPYVDYSSNDGQFRKYRVALIEGIPYLCHLAISSHWIVHYLNADMMGSAEKCAEEASCMAEFENSFGHKHQQAFAAIYANLPLEYLIIDCAETKNGRLLLFEVDTSAIVHAMDSVEWFPYKQPQMHKIFKAFQAMLMRRAVV